jgi:hypothetical protein
MYAYRLDDWLVIRTDMAGHESVVNTEMWYHWNDEESNVADILAQARRLPESAWLGCEQGWCSKCEATLGGD